MDDDDRQIDWPGWFLRGCVAIAFVYIGLDKFDETPNGEWIRIFDRIGFGQWFRHATGLVEILGGVLLVPPRTKFVGAALLGSAMVGAIVVHIAVIHDAVLSVVPLALLAVVLGVAFRIPDEPLGRRRKKRSST
jgi:putative oxidoreductase